MLWGFCTELIVKYLSHSYTDQEPEGDLLVDCGFTSLTCRMYDPGNKLPRRPPWAPSNILAVLASSFHL